MILKWNDTDVPTQFCKMLPSLFGGAKAAQHSWSMPERAEYTARRDFALLALLGQPGKQAQDALRGLRRLRSMEATAGGHAASKISGSAARGPAAGDANSPSKSQRKRAASVIKMCG